MSDKFAFNKIDCPVCRQKISAGGAAYTSHLRAHVRKSEAVEHKRGTRLLFIPSGQQDSFIEAEPYAKLGDEPLPNQPKGVWEVPDLAKTLPAFDPASYFITSGEGCKKADKMTEDAYSLAVKCRSFRDKLYKARGSKKYLETCRENGRLLVKTKEPRPKGDKEEE
jgi:hypothetical protein